MGNTDKPSAQQITDNIVDHMLGLPSAKLLFPEDPFPTKFHIIHPQHGHFELVEEFPGQVLRYTTQESIDRAITQFCYNLPAAEYPHYRLPARRVREVVRHWFNRSQVLDAKIYPVLEKSAPGYCFHRLPFDMEDGETPLFDNFMARMESNVRQFMAYIGSLFDPEAPRQHYLWILGEGGDGKGVLSQVLHRVFQEAYVSLQTFKEPNQFFTSQLLGKRLGVFQDCHRPKFVQSELFMQLSGGDPVLIEKKGKDAYTAILDTFFIFLSNMMPQFSGSKAHQRRAIVVKMTPREADDCDKAEYPERLWAETPHFLYKCCRVWEEVKAEGGIKPDQDILDEIAEEDGAKWEALLDEKFTVTDNMNDGVTAADLQQVLQWDKKLHNGQISSFKDWLARVHGVKRRKIHKNGKRVWAYPGLFLKSPRQDFDATQF